MQKGSAALMRSPPTASGKSSHSVTLSLSAHSRKCGFQESMRDSRSVANTNIEAAFDIMAFQSIRDFGTDDTIGFQEQPVNSRWGKRGSSKSNVNSKAGLSMSKTEHGCQKLVDNDLRLSSKSYHGERNAVKKTDMLGLHSKHGLPTIDKERSQSSSHPRSHTKKDPLSSRSSHGRQKTTTGSDEGNRTKSRSRSSSRDRLKSKNKSSSSNKSKEAATTSSPQKLTPNVIKPSDFGDSVMSFGSVDWEKEEGTKEGDSPFTMQSNSCANSISNHNNRVMEPLIVEETDNKNTGEINPFQVVATPSTPKMKLKKSPCVSPSPRSITSKVVLTKKIPCFSPSPRSTSSKVLMTPRSSGAGRKIKFVPKSAGKVASFKVL
jgi:hypothetical protein